MHSHDRTLLSRLAFGDPDKKSPLHDLACRFLAQREQHDKLLQVLGAGKQLLGQFRWIAEETAEVDCAWCKGTGDSTEQYPMGGYYRCKTCNGSKRTYKVPKCAVFDDVESYNHSATLECPIQKGHDQYATTIGFLDVYLSTVLAAMTEGQIFRYRDHRDSSDTTHSCRTSLAVEVKINDPGVGDVLRQLNLYRSYINADFWVLASVYQPSPSELNVLKNENIFHVRLGPAFEAYVEQEKQAKATSTAVSPEF